jgi:hypothetical protein
MDAKQIILTLKIVGLTLVAIAQILSSETDSKQLA